MFYTGIVVSNIDDDLEGKIEVFTPALNVKFKEKSSETTTKTDNLQFGDNLIEDNDTDNVEQNLNVIKANTMLCRPFDFGGSNTNGSFIVPEPEDIVSVFFMDGDMSQAYYTVKSKYKKGKILDFGKDSEYQRDFSVAELKPQLKVLYKSKQRNLLVFNDNLATRGLILKCVDHKIKIDSNKTRDQIELRTRTGFSIKQDEIKKEISVVTPRNNFIKISDNTDTIDIRVIKNLNINAGGNININAIGKIMVNGARIDLN